MSGPQENKVKRYAERWDELRSHARARRQSNAGVGAAAAAAAADDTVGSVDNSAVNRTIEAVSEVTLADARSSAIPLSGSALTAGPGAAPSTPTLGSPTDSLLCAIATGSSA